MIRMTNRPDAFPDRTCQAGCGCPASCFDDSRARRAAAPDRSADARASEDFESAAPYQAEVEEGLGAAVAILVDTSGSMKEDAPGDSRPKYVVAREALETMLDATDAFVAKRPDFPIKIGIYSFSSDVSTVLPLQPYDRDVVRAALARLPRPGGGTAIGEAMRAARPDLYRAGVFRKYLLVVTDGENTVGPQPGRRGARHLPEERGRRPDLFRRVRHRAPRGSRS